MSKFERHFFVCQQQRPPGGKPSCGPQGAGEIFSVLQEGLGSNPELWGKVQVTATGCLGPCFDGPSMVVYPEAVWYAKLTPADAREIVESHMRKGEVVERLVYKWPDN